MTAQAILERAQSAGVSLHLDDGQVQLSGDKSAIAALLPDLRQHRAELVQLLSQQTIDQVQKAPPDPMLLALAMAYCDRTGASPKARADWRSDVQATPHGDREELAAYLRAELAKLAPVAPAMPSTAAPTAPAKPVPKFSIKAPWRAADRTWLTHWQQCPQCQTAGRTNTTRCAHGQDLFTTYQQATDIEARK